MNNNTSSTGKGSFTDTLKGYVHDAMAKGQEALHKVQGQFSQAGQAHSQTAGNGAQANDAFAEVNQFNANCAANRPGSTGTHTATQPAADDAFAEVNQFNANCAAAGNPGSKSSKGAM